MSAHTPGPWTFGEKFTDAFGSEVRVVRGGDRGVAWILHTKALDANARLIAAAPELLGALKALVEAPMFEDLAPHLDRARAAIAKAEGRP